MPTMHHRMHVSMVGTLRFAYPTDDGLRTDFKEAGKDAFRGGVTQLVRRIRVTI